MFRPDHALSIALYEPEIPGNTGAIGRICAATATPLHLIGRLGFSLRHPDAKRAGMNYWDRVETHRHINFQALLEQTAGSRVVAFTTKATIELWDFAFRPDDVLLFGPESRGLPDDLIQPDSGATVRIPMAPEVRSLNLATSAAIALYEALRQHR